MADVFSQDAKPQTARCCCYFIFLAKKNSPDRQCNLTFINILLVTLCCELNMDAKIRARPRATIKIFKVV